MMKDTFNTHMRLELDRFEVEFIGKDWAFGVIQKR